MILIGGGESAGYGGQPGPGRRRGIRDRDLADPRGFLVDGIDLSGAAGRPG